MPLHRRFYGLALNLSPGLALCALILAPLLAVAPSALANQNLNELDQQVSDYLQEHYQGSAKKLTIQVNSLDPRLQLARCDSPLGFELRDLSGKGGAVSVKTSCAGPKPWSIYVAAQVDLYREILVASRAIGRGERLTAGDTEYSLANTSLLRQGYLISEESVIGQISRRNLEPGEPLREGILETPLAVTRGQTVTLEARSGAITVVTQAEALSNARVGEQVRVRNTRSERIVSANVIGEGHVAASF